jgi:hypothetical protein
MSLAGVRNLQASAIVQFSDCGLTKRRYAGATSFANVSLTELVSSAVSFESRLLSLRAVAS